MKDDTTVFNVGDSVCVRIPANMARYFNLKETTEPRKCTIEDTGQKTALLTFE
jgi:antitoxin component of MazEF toxin-antitoxin module